MYIYIYIYISCGGSGGHSEEGDVVFPSQLNFNLHFIFSNPAISFFLFSVSCLVTELQAADP